MSEKYKKKHKKKKKVIVIFMFIYILNLNHIYEGQDSNALTPYILFLFFNLQT